MRFDSIVIAIDDVRDQVGLRRVEVQQPELVGLDALQSLCINRKTGGQ